MRRAESVHLTGVTGFLGANVAPLLLGEPWLDELRCLVRPGRELPASLAGHPKVKVLRGDLATVELPSRTGVVVHCAALRDGSPEQLDQINVQATRRLARQAAAQGCDFLYVSSQSVYGATEVSPVGEEVAAEPETDYARSKLAGEQAVEAGYAGSANTWITLRLARFYGGFPTLRYEGALGAALDAARTGAEMSLKGHGRFLMDLLHVRDAASAIVAACRNRSGLRGLYNVGSGRGVSMLELARLAQTLSPGLRWTLDPSKPERPGLWLDGSRFRAAAGWEPRISLEEGLAEALSILRG